MSSTTKTPERTPFPLNPGVRDLAPSATLAINERSDELLRQGRRIYKLGFGQSPFPVPASVVEELRRHAAEKAYLPVKGLAALRQAVAEHHQRTFGIECSADDVLVGPGSKELMFHLQLVYPGELVLPSPSWVSYAPQAQILGRPVRYLPTQAKNGWCLEAERLDALCRVAPDQPRLLILNYPANPGGTSFTEAAQRQLAEVARRHGVLVRADEIYGLLDHEGEHASIARFYPEGTILSSGLSKWCGAGGWRLGVFVVPRRLRRLTDAMAAVASETYTTVSAPIQYAAVAAYRGGEDIEAFLRQSRRILGALGGWAAARLRRAGVAVVEPHGGFYLFPDFSATRRRAGDASSVELCERLLDETGVALLPGSDFGRPSEELTTRLAYVNFDGGRALAEAERVPLSQPLGEAYLRACCGETLAAIERICDWVES